MFFAPQLVIEMEEPEVPWGNDSGTGVEIFGHKADLTERKYTAHFIWYLREKNR